MKIRSRRYGEIYIVKSKYKKFWKVIRINTTRESKIPIERLNKYEELKKLVI